MCAAFVLFFAGWFAGELRRDESYTVTSDALFPADATPAPPQSTFVSDVLVDLNTAQLDDLTGLPGIGEAKAQAILDYRREHGPFRRVEDIMQIKGIGEGIFQQLEPYITLTDEGGQTP
ncbi:MAG: helix-hairpin-helix domain-containing protein [Oscillospiraceae bacterium]